MSLTITTALTAAIGKLESVSPRPPLQIADYESWPWDVCVSRNTGDGDLPVLTRQAGACILSEAGGAAFGGQDTELSGRPDAQLLGQSDYSWSYTKLITGSRSKVPFHTSCKANTREPDQAIWHDGLNRSLTSRILLRRDDWRESFMHWPATLLRDRGSDWTWNADAHHALYGGCSLSGC